jgi:hypothetical protein
MTLDMDFLFITALKDIGREKWGENKINHERKLDTYIEYFVNLANNIEYNLLVYLENDVKEYILSKYQFKENIRFMEMEKVYTFYDKYLEEEEAIMNSQIYKNKIPDTRKTFPEHCCAKYNAIVHSKVNFVADAKRCVPDYKFYVWIDFGFTRDLSVVPKNINLQKVPINKITIQIVNKVPYERPNPNYMLSSFNDYLATSSFVIPSVFVEVYEKLYEKKLLEFQNNYIVDDDQGIANQLYYDNPSMFNLILDTCWFKMYSHLV